MWLRGKSIDGTGDENDEENSLKDVIGEGGRFKLDELILSVDDWNR